MLQLSMNILTKSTIEEVAQIMGISEAFIEKDWFVTKAIQLLSNTRFDDFQFIFTGGTSLSKAHKLIFRFSEDIDFKIISPSLKHLSRSQQAKSLSNLKNNIVALLKKEFPILDNQITARNENKYSAVVLNYPTFFIRSNTLRPHILLEFTVSEIALPTVALPVSSLINEVARQPAEIQRLECVNPVEIAAEKLSAITWRIAERVRNSPKDDPDVVRHIHDLAILSDIALQHISFIDIVKNTILIDDKRSTTIRGLAIEVKFERMMTILENDSQYSKEYSRFVQSMSYAPTGSTPSFEVALEAVQQLIASVK